MAHTVSDVKGITSLKLNGKGLSVCIIASRWNETIIAELIKGATQNLLAAGVSSSDIEVIRVPGAYELPFAAKHIIEHSRSSGKPLDAVIAIGCLIKGDTMHFEYICSSVSSGLSSVGLSTGVPVIFGVLTCLSDDQALVRAGLQPNDKRLKTKPHNHGLDWGSAAVEMALLAKAKPVIKSKL